MAKRFHVMADELLKKFDPEKQTSSVTPVRAKRCNIYSRYIPRATKHALWKMHHRLTTQAKNRAVIIHAVQPYFKIAMNDLHGIYFANAGANTITNNGISISDVTAGNDGAIKLISNKFSHAVTIPLLGFTLSYVVDNMAFDDHV